MVFNQRQANGLWDLRVGARDCSNPRPLPGLAPWDGHRGSRSMTPDGRWLLVERAEGSTRAWSGAEAGKGLGVELQLLDRQTGRLTQLTSARKAIIWGQLNADATKVVWSEAVKWGSEVGSLLPWSDYYLGQWALHVADITPDGHLTNERSWSNAGDPGFLETYGWLGARLIFDSDQGIPNVNGWGWYHSQLWTMPADLSPPPTRLSPPFRTPTWCSGRSWCPRPYDDHDAYHEFAHVAPAGMFPEPGTWLLFSVVWEYDLTGRAYDTTPPYNGLDLWRMRPDGSGRQRVTAFNQRAYANVEGLAFDPADPRSIYAAVASDPGSETIDAYRITP
jgi:hypothetical protein